MNLYDWQQCVSLEKGKTHIGLQKVDKQPTKYHIVFCSYKVVMSYMIQQYNIRRPDSSEVGCNLPVPTSLPSPKPCFCYISHSYELVMGATLQQRNLRLLEQLIRWTYRVTITKIGYIKTNFYYMKVAHNGSSPMCSHLSA